MPKLSELPSVESFSGDDIAVIVRDGQTVKIRAADMVEAAVDRVIDTVEASQEIRWRSIPKEDLEPTPISSSRIGIASSAFRVGLPVRWTVDGVNYFGMVADASPGNYIDVRGPAIDVAKTISDVAMGGAERVAQLEIFIAGGYGASLGEKIASAMKSYSRWSMGPARVVSFAAAHNRADTTSQPKVNIKLNGNPVSSADGGLGVRLPNTAGQWTENPLATIVAADYAVSYGSTFEVEVTAVAGTGNASGLTVNIVIVLE